MDNNKKIVNFGNEPYYCDLIMYTNTGGVIPIGSEIIAYVEFTGSLKSISRTVKLVLKNTEATSSAVLLLNGGEKFYIEVRPTDEAIADIKRTPGIKDQHWVLKGTYCIETSSIENLRGQGYKDDAPISIIGVDEQTKRVYQSGTINTYIPSSPITPVSAWLKKQFVDYGFEIGRWLLCDTKFSYPYQLTGSMYDIIQEVVKLLWHGEEHNMLLWRSRDGKINLDTTKSLIRNPPLGQAIVPLLYHNENGDGGSLASGPANDYTKSFTIHKSTINHMNLKSTTEGLNGYRICGFDPFTKKLGSKVHSFDETLSKTNGSRIGGSATLITDSHYSKNNITAISTFKPLNEFKDIAHEVLRVHQEAFMEDVFTTNIYTAGVNTAVHCGSILGITMETMSLIDNDLDPINSYQAITSTVSHIFGGFGAITEAKVNRNTIFESKYGNGRIR